MKPTKWGLKAFVLADSTTGYIVNIIPYTGWETKEIYLSQCNPDLPLHAQVLVALILINTLANSITSMLTGSILMFHW